MRRGHRIAISAIAATALTAGGGAALVAGPRTQAVRAVGQHAAATPAGGFAEFSRLRADVLLNQSQIDAMARAILLARERIQAQGKRQAALALRRAEAGGAGQSAAADAVTADAVAAHAVHAAQPAGTRPVLAREPGQTRGNDAATPAGARQEPATAPTAATKPATAPTTPATAPTTPATTPAPDSTTSPPGDDDDDGRGGRG